MGQVILWSFIFHLFVLTSCQLDVDDSNNNNHNNNVDPQTESILFMRQGDNEITLGPTSKFFHGQVPFLIPLGTDEDSNEYDYGEYTTTLEESNDGNFGTKIPQDQEEDYSGPSVVDLTSRPKQSQIKPELQPDLSVQFESQDKFKPSPKVQTQNKQLQGNKGPQGLGKNKGRILPEPEPDFSVDSNGSPREFQQKPNKNKPLSWPVQNRPAFRPDLEPDFAVSFDLNQQGPQKQKQPSQFKPNRPASSISNQPNVIAQEPQPELGLSFDDNQANQPQQPPKRPQPINPRPRPTTSSGKPKNRFVPELEPDFSVPFRDNGNRFPQGSNKRPISPIPARPLVPQHQGSVGRPITDPEEEFSLTFTDDITTTPQSPTQRPVNQGTNGLLRPNKFIPELEPDFSLSFEDKDRQFPNNRPVTAVPAFITETTIAPQDSTASRPVNLNPELDPELSSGFDGDNFDVSHQRPITPIAPVTQASTFVPPFIQNFDPTQTDEENQNQNPVFITTFRPDLLPELSGSFGSTEDLPEDNGETTEVNFDQDQANNQILFPGDVSNNPAQTSQGATIPSGEVIKNNQSGLIDFSNATRGEDGRLCIPKTEYIESVVKEPVVECIHKKVEKCHYTYVTQFTPVPEQLCEDNFEKLCQITFNAKSVKEKVKKCYRPLTKVCNETGNVTCNTVYETSCTTRYIAKQNGTKHVGETTCAKLPVKICGPGCSTIEGPEECHEKEVESIMNVPEEICDLNPQKNCRFVTKLVPKLKPKHECTQVPKEVCNVRLGIPKTSRRPYQSIWCLDESPVDPDLTYGDSTNKIR